MSELRLTVPKCTSLVDPRESDPSMQQLKYFRFHDRRGGEMVRRTSSLQSGKHPVQLYRGYYH